MTRLTVDFDWEVAGQIRLESGRPVFPALPDAPGLYRFSFHWRDRPAGIYIGETDRLRRRAQHYRTPGVRQQTNLRMNAKLVEALSSGASVAFSIATSATISLDDGAALSLDLARQVNRLIIENAAMAAVIGKQEANPTTGPVLMNRPGVGEAEWG